MKFNKIKKWLVTPIYYQKLGFALPLVALGIVGTWNFTAGIIACVLCYFAVHAVSSIKNRRNNKI